MVSGALQACKWRLRTREGAEGSGSGKLLLSLRLLLRLALGKSEPVSDALPVCRPLRRRCRRRRRESVRRALEGSRSGKSSAPTLCTRCRARRRSCWLARSSLSRIILYIKRGGTSEAHNAAAKSMYKRSSSRHIAATSCSPTRRASVSETPNSCYLCQDWIFTLSIRCTFIFSMLH